jgi:hypothetical protein
LIREGVLSWKEILLISCGSQATMCITLFKAHKCYERYELRDMLVAVYFFSSYETLRVLCFVCTHRSNSMSFRHLERHIK